MASGSGLANPSNGGAIIRPAVATVKVGGASIGARVRSVIWRAGDQPNMAEIEVPGARFEALGIGPNQTVEITVKVKGKSSVRIFTGRTTGGHSDYSGNDESVSIVALGPRWDLSKDYVLGAEVRAFAPSEGGDASSAEPVCCTAIPCVFNANGRGNKIDDGSENIFQPDPRLVPTIGAEWSVAEMIAYIYRQRLHDRRYDLRPFGGPEPPNVVGDPLGFFSVASQQELNEAVVYSLNVDGLSLLDAIHRALDTAGFRWWLRPVSGGVGELRATLKTFGERSVGHKLRLPRVSGGTLPGSSVSNPDVDGSNPNHNQGTLNFDWSKVLAQVTAVGAPIAQQFEFELVPGWRLTDEADVLGSMGTPYVIPLSAADAESVRIKTTERSSGAWNPDPDDPSAAYHRDVGRSFILDESGIETDRDSGSTPPRAPFDWIDPLTSTAYDVREPVAVKPRPFLKSVIGGRFGDPGDGTERRGRSVPVKLEVKHADEADFIGVDVAWELDPERGGIRITERDIMRRPLFNELTGKFAEKARIEVRVETDWLAAVATPGSAGPVPARAVLKAEREYSDETASADALSRLATGKLRVNQAPRRAASFTVPWIAPGYEIGHWITGISGRNLGWSGQIVEVRFDCVAQTTTITLDDETIFLAPERPR